MKIHLRPDARIVCFNGHAVPLLQLLEDLGMRHRRAAVSARIWMGWSIEDAIHRPFRQKRAHGQTLAARQARRQRSSDWYRNNSERRRQLNAATQRRRQARLREAA